MKMKTNRKTIKVIIAIVVIIGASFWVISTIRPRYYEGKALNFPVSEGSVTVTNPSEALSVQLISTSSRTFRVSSASQGMSGSSIRENSGSVTAQVFEFVLPSGTSEFTVASNTDVIFDSNTATNLQVKVNPLNVETTRIRILALGILVVAMLFYISHLYDHLWISAARRQNALADTVAQDAEQENFNRIMKSRSSKTRP
jgi:hypothetical protein